MKRIPPLRALGFLLILAALVLHFFNVRTGRSHSQGADVIRHVASLPALSLGVQAYPAADEPKGYQLCPPDAVAWFRARLAEAEKGVPPKDFVADRAYDFSLVLTNHVRALFHGVRAAGSDALWLSLREPVPRDSKADSAEPPAMRDWPPALVTGLASLLDRADEERLSQQIPILFPHADDHGFTEADLADTAATLRRLATLPFVRAELVPAAGGRTLALGANAMPALVAALGEARSAELPEDGTIEGTDHTLFIFLDDGFVVLLRAVVPDAEPADVLVGLRSVVTGGEGGGADLVTTPPALVPGLAELLAPAPAETSVQSEPLPAT